MKTTYKKITACTLLTTLVLLAGCASDGVSTSMHVSTHGYYDPFYPYHWAHPHHGRDNLIIVTPPRSSPPSLPSRPSRPSRPRR